MSIFKDKILLITGGTGSFGNAVLRRFLDSDIREIRIFSRDEKKQDDMRHFLQANRPDVSTKVKFYIGNVRNREAIDFAMNGVDYVFSAAALKQVPSCEFYPMEAVRTNVEGTNNVLLSAIAHGVKNVVVLSTDKAAYPINAMGISKAMMEKVIVAKSRTVSPENLAGRTAHADKLDEGRFETGRCASAEQPLFQPLLRRAPCAAHPDETGPYPAFLCGYARYVG